MISSSQKWWLRDRLCAPDGPIQKMKSPEAASAPNVPSLQLWHNQYIAQGCMSVLGSADYQKSPAQ